MTDDGKFKRNFSRKGQPAQEFGGTYTVEENVLVLERKDGGSLLAEVTLDSAANSIFVCSAHQKPTKASISQSEIHKSIFHQHSEAK